MRRLMVIGCVLALAGCAAPQPPPVAGPPHAADGQWSLTVPRLAGDRACSATTFDPTFTVQGGVAAGRYSHPAVGAHPWYATVAPDGALSGKVSVPYSGGESVEIAGTLSRDGGAGSIVTAPSACRGQWTAKRG